MNTSLYQPPKQELWTGRASDPSLDPQYWYQAIQCHSFNNLPDSRIDVGLIGYACDEGVRRNHGRVGASEAPTLFRERLAKLPFHLGSRVVADFGDVVCMDQELESCQQAFSEIIATLVSRSIVPIAIGGGHDIAYAHFKGIWEGINEASYPKIGIVNFDAHFDLRPFDEQGTSGTPFNQILTEYGDHVSYLALGIQQSGNTKQLFEIAAEMGVNYVTNFECAHEHFDTVQRELDYFIDQVDYIYITIDMDGFASAYAPGVSAPSPFGFDPYFATKSLQYLLDSNQVIACDIAETNPRYDRDNRTVNLAARLADFIASNMMVSEFD